jgi:hypothetical protein
MSASPAAEAANIALQIDVQTSLAVARATTRAMCAISRDAQQAVVAALENEARVQEEHGGPVGELVGALVTAFAAELK